MYQDIKLRKLDLKINTKKMSLKAFCFPASAINNIYSKDQKIINDFNDMSELGDYDPSLYISSTIYYFKHIEQFFKK